MNPCTRQSKDGSATVHWTGDDWAVVGTTEITLKDLERTVLAMAARYSSIDRIVSPIWAKSMSITAKLIDFLRMLDVHWYVRFVAPAKKLGIEDECTNVVAIGRVLGEMAKYDGVHDRVHTIVVVLDMVDRVLWRCTREIE